MSLPSYAMNQLSFPQMYEQSLVGPLFRPWAETIVAELGLSSGDRLLDVACGTGIVARVAHPRVAGAVGIDVSAGMLGVARAIAPDIDWREGDATALPLHPGEQFSVVICHQGLQFFADKAAAAAQMRRALAPSGRLAVSVWRSDDEMPFLHELRQVAQRHLGPIADQRYAFGDAAALETVLRDAGLLDVRSKTLSRTMRFEVGEPFLRLNAMAFVGMSAAGKAIDEAERRRVIEVIVSESAPVARTFSKGGALAFELRTNLATARG